MVKVDKTNPWYIFSIIFIFMLVVLNISLSLKIEEIHGIINYDSKSTSKYEKQTTSLACPDSIGGSNTSILKIKFFYSKYCYWCKKEEPILQRLVKLNGNAFEIEWYDVNKCTELVDKYKVNGVPTFIFSASDNVTEYSHYGFIYEKDLFKFVCDVSGGC